jgi:N-acetylneuraminate epimerase
MTRYPLFLLILLVMITEALYAQQGVSSIQWKIAGELPSANSHERCLGFSGPVTGIHKNTLVVAGGANFPNAMPWVGGKKKYYHCSYLLNKKARRLICLFKI